MLGVEEAEVVGDTDIKETLIYYAKNPDIILGDGKSWKGLVQWSSLLMDWKAAGTQWILNQCSFKNFELF